jgi:hypothetical protein
LKIFSFHVKCSESYNVNYFSNHNLKHYVDVAILLSWLVRFELHWGQCLFRWRSVRNRYTESSSWGIEGEQEVHWRFVDCNNHASCRTKQKLPCLPAPIRTLLSTSIQPKNHIGKRIRKTVQSLRTKEKGKWHTTTSMH